MVRSALLRPKRARFQDQLAALHPGQAEVGEQHVDRGILGQVDPGMAADDRPELGDKLGRIRPAVLEAGRL